MSKARMSKKEKISLETCCRCRKSKPEGKDFLTEVTIDAGIYGMCTDLCKPCIKEVLAFMRRKKTIESGISMGHLNG